MYEFALTKISGKDANLILGIIDAMYGDNIQLTNMWYNEVYNNISSNEAKSKLDSIYKILLECYEQEEI